MKTKVVFIYNENGKLIQVADVRSLESEDFSHWDGTAKANVKAILEENRKNELDRERKYKEDINNLQSQINDLRAVVRHILGLECYSDDVIKELLREEEEEPNEEK